MGHLRIALQAATAALWGHSAIQPINETEFGGSLHCSAGSMFTSNANVKDVTVWGYVVGATWETNSGTIQSSGAMRIQNTNHEVIGCRWKRRP